MSGGRQHRQLAVLHGVPAPKKQSTSIVRGRSKPIIRFFEPRILNKTLNFFLGLAWKVCAWNAFSVQYATLNLAMQDQLLRLLGCRVIVSYLLAVCPQRISQTTFHGERRKPQLFFFFFFSSPPPSPCISLLLCICYIPCVHLRFSAHAVSSQSSGKDYSGSLLSNQTDTLWGYTGKFVHHD